MRFGAGLLLSLCTISAATPALAQDDFRRCAREVALSSMRGMDDPIDKKRVINDVLLICDKVPDDVLMGPRSGLDAWTSRQRLAVAAMVGKLEIEARAQKTDETLIGHQYFLCLKNHATAPALTTAEAADLIVQATLMTCPAERKAVAHVHTKYNDRWSEAAAQAMCLARII